MLEELSPVYENQKTNINLSHRKTDDSFSPCIFYKNESCTPYNPKFKICPKCHRCKVFNMENLTLALFNKIISTAIFLMSLFDNIKKPIISSGQKGAKGGGTPSGGGKK